MMAQLKRLATKSRTMLIAYKIYHNWQFKKRFESGNTESQHGSTHTKKSLAESLGYINTQFADYLKYSGLSLEELRGRNIFELGFGDNIGVALKFLSVGAEQVVCLDKFYSQRDQEQEREIYRALRETLSDDEQQLFDEAVDLSEGIKVNADRLKCLYGADVENSPDLTGSALFDIVLSRGAIQDIYNPDAAFAAMDRLLKPGGLMLHKIDLSDQGMFRIYGMHPLSFLTISESVYRLMAVDSGKPNRKKMDYYRRKMQELGYDAKILITDIIGRGGKGDLHPHKERAELNVDYSPETLALVQQIRPKLAGQFRQMPDEELLVDGIFIIAKKPE